MELIEILKGARKRIEAADYLADGYYEMEEIMYGKCYCAVGHVFNEMNFTQEDFDNVDGFTIDSLNFDIDIKGKLLPLKPIATELQMLQDANDQSSNDARKRNVLNKLDEIIEKVEVLQNGNSND
ncbi:hypothetical protein PP655_gp047 [Bacillus phage PBC4]|uniref:Uncharacterized protein n=1 Tax=Bacillus phage PBC4 TaxID=1675028 RepID=A0A1D6X894_9CAUD|nr:hypothetical protein PP655_gp047 [Bacillus phage PBC4]AKQ08239.1 hypothetical protein PBC4_047 [Bacillus phage PBC4]